MGLLALAAGLMLAARQAVFAEALLPTFAASGALHAVALVFALRAPAAVFRGCLFIAIAAALNVLTLYIGILGSQLFAVLPAEERLYVLLGLCSASGAITYGSSIRLFWVQELSSRSVLAIAIACVLATLAAFFVRGYFQNVEGWWLATVWWFAFSVCLWYLDTNPDSLRRTGSPTGPRLR